MRLSLRVLGFSFRTRRGRIITQLGGLLRGCSGLSLSVSGSIFATLLGRCHRGISPRCLPPVCRAVSALCGNGRQTCVSALCTHSRVAAPQKLGHCLRHSAAFDVLSSPTVSLNVSLLISCCSVGRTVIRTSRGVRGSRQLFGTTIHQVCTSHGFCPSTGSAVQLDFKAIYDCSPFGNTVCGCCAAPLKVFRGVQSRRSSPSFRIDPHLLRLFDTKSFKHCTSRGNRVEIYFVSGGSVANNGSNDTVFGTGKRLLKLTFSNG